MKLLLMALGIDEQDIRRRYREFVEQQPRSSRKFACVKYREFKRRFIERVAREKGFDVDVVRRLIA